MSVNNYPKISIVTPSYNQGQFIEQTILSVINQGYPNLEYIIIDGGSTDNTVDVIKKYSDKIAYWISEKDAGQSDALNKGLAKCTGEIFNWINSDDYYEAGTFFKLANYFNANKNVTTVSGWCNCFNDTTSEIIFKSRSEYFQNVETTLLQQKINQPATFYSLKTIKELGGINTTLHYGMDLELWFKYLAKYGQQNILLVEDTLAHFRLHDESKTVQLQPKFKEEEVSIWHNLLENIYANKNVLKYFANEAKNIYKQKWDCTAINKEKLIILICKKYFYDFYNIKNYKATKYAFWKLFLKGGLPFQKSTFGILYNIYLKKGIVEIVS
jgi:glycosyltransferase involved in cell wall biosynthesis